MGVPGGRSKQDFTQLWLCHLTFRREKVMRVGRQSAREIKSRWTHASFLWCLGGHWSRRVWEQQQPRPAMSSVIIHFPFQSLFTTWSCDPTSSSSLPKATEVKYIDGHFHLCGTVCLSLSPVGVAILRATTVLPGRSPCGLECGETALAPGWKGIDQFLSQRC
jgi:hypothetical protein